MKTRTGLGWASLVAASGLLLACGGDDTVTDDDDGGGPSAVVGTGGSAMGGQGGVDVGAGGTGGGGGSTMVCEPSTVVECYSGPPATKNVGVCVPGTQTCLADGSGYGACIGEVLPSAETCATPGDEDCNGQANESGPGCSCTPNTTASCYSGPAATQNVGICHGGTQTCNAQGTGYGPCTGEVLPQSENCATAADEDCDGTTPPCPMAVIDLRADTNRNGIVETNVASEDANENVWTSTHGAVFLANLDDDQNACPTTGTDSALAACNDAADTVINGTSDLVDLARLKTVPWPAAPSNATASLTVSNPGATYVRLFKKVGNNFSVYTPGGALSVAEIQAGVEFAIEGKDIVRDDTVWDGYVDVTLSINGGTAGSGSDTVQMRLSPVMFRHHLDPMSRAYVTSLNSTSSLDFRTDLLAATNAAGVPTTNFFVSDQWTQDFFETAYMSMPSTSGQHVMHINFRSANYTSNGLRAAGRVVFTDLRGPDVAGAVEYNASHPNYMDTLNSFGNLETIPPYTYNGQSWPLGRVLRGSTSSFYPDPDFDKMVQSQGVQDIVYIDTAWLLVAHVDETLSFIKANSPRGWVLLRNDATMAKNMLLQQQANGHGSTPMFVGMYWTGNVPAQVTINQVLADTDVMNESAWAATEVQSQVNTLVAATGLASNEMVAIPFLHETSSGYSVAYQPGTVNGMYVSNTIFAPPVPHGPSINNVDIFEQQLVNALSPFGVNVYFVEDWNLYHRLLGEVHCGSNATRTVPANVKWWESGL